MHLEGRRYLRPHDALIIVHFLHQHAHQARDAYAVTADHRVGPLAFPVGEGQPEILAVLLAQIEHVPDLGTLGSRELARLVPLRGIWRSQTFGARILFVLLGYFRVHAELARIAIQYVILARVREHDEFIGYLLAETAAGGLGHLG